MPSPANQLTCSCLVEAVEMQAWAKMEYWKMRVGLRSVDVPGGQEGTYFPDREPRRFGGPPLQSLERWSHWLLTYRPLQYVVRYRLNTDPVRQSRCDLCTALYDWP